MSFEEKRKKMCEFLYEKRDFFQLKDLEKQCPKAKGIVMQSVKEVLQSLVDDNLVNFEKIGTSNYYWSFPSAAVQSRKTKIAQLEEEVGKISEAIESLQSQIEMAKQGREESDERTQLEEELDHKERTYQQNQKELDMFKDMDPDLFAAKSSRFLIYIEKATVEAKDAVNRWTDNIYILQGYCAEKFMIAKADFNTNFGVPEDLDYYP